MQNSFIHNDQYHASVSFSEWRQSYNLFLYVQEKIQYKYKERDLLGYAYGSLIQLL